MVSPLRTIEPRNGDEGRAHLRPEFDLLTALRPGMVARDAEAPARSTVQHSVRSVPKPSSPLPRAYGASTWMVKVLLPRAICGSCICKSALCNAAVAVPQLAMALTVSKQQTLRYLELVRKIKMLYLDERHQLHKPVLN